MRGLKRWHMVVGLVGASLAVAAKAADMLDAHIAAQVQAIAVPRSDFDRLEGKVDHITDLLLNRKH